MAVETGRNENQFRLEANQDITDFTFEQLDQFVISDSGREREVYGIS